MEPEIFVDILSDALFLVIKLVSAIVVPGLIIGLVVAVFQAATSINEQTLSFVPKLVLVLLSFGLLANLMLVQLTDYFVFIFDQVTQVG